MKKYEKILEFINGLEIVDTHEHLPLFESEEEREDVLKEYLIHCFVRDLLCWSK